MPGPLPQLVVERGELGVGGAEAVRVGIADPRDQVPVITGRARQAQRRPWRDDVQSPVRVEHVGQPHQVLLVAAAAVVQYQQSLRVAVGGSLDCSKGHDRLQSSPRRFLHSVTWRRNARCKAARAIPMARLIAAAQVVMLARRHWHRLDPHERQRLLTLVRVAAGRRGAGSAGERIELARLIAKADPKLFAGLVVQKLSPVPFPKPNGSRETLTRALTLTSREGLRSRA